MRRKIVFLLICLFCVIFLPDEVLALDHSLFYSVEDFNVDANSNKINMSGWAFIHNVHQCGNGDCKNGNVEGDRTKYKTESSQIKSWKSEGTNDLQYWKNSGDVNKSIIFIQLRDSDGNIVYSNRCQGVTGCDESTITLNYTPIDLFTWMCTEKTYCYGYVTDNVGFQASIDLSKIKPNKSYSLYIGVDLLEYTDGYTGNNPVPLGVSKVVYDGSSMTVLSNGAKVTIDNLTNIIKNRNNDQEGRLMKFDNGMFNLVASSGYYFNYESYRVKSIKRDYSIGATNKKHDHFPLMYEVYTGEIGTDTPGCGLDAAEEGLKKCSTYWGPATWFTTTGDNNIIIKVEQNDKVCKVSNDDINVCSGDSVGFSCEQMTVYATTSDGKKISAVVSLQEDIEFISGENGSYSDEYDSYFGGVYSLYNIVKGRSFYYTVTYKNTATWSFVSNSKDYGTVSESDGDDVIKEAMKQYYTEIDVKKLPAITSDDIPEFTGAGSWICSKKGYKNQFANGKAETVCQYRIKHLYINGDGNASYLENELNADGIVLTNGRNFYIPRSYNKDKFTWKVGSVDGLSTLKVRTSVSNKNSTGTLISISSEDGGGSSNTMCYVNIVNSVGIGDETDGSTCIPDSDTPWRDVFPDGLYLYRSVTVNNPFPDGDIPQNWNNEDYIRRLNGSYSNHLDYRTQILNYNVVNSLRNINAVYTNWSDTSTTGNNPRGKNIYVKNEYYSLIDGKHCKYGFFDDSCS